MKALQLLFIVFICLSQNIGQSQEIQTSKTYKVWVKTLFENEKQIGYLSELKESSIMLLDKQNLSPFPEIHIDQIKHIKFRKKGRVLRGAAIGAAIGFISGAILLPGEDCKNAEPKLFGIGGCVETEPMDGAIAYAKIGAIIGVFIGKGKIKIPIHGSPSYYQKNKEKMKRFLYEYD
jgi:hypothetical protein